MGIKCGRWFNPWDEDCICANSLLFCLCCRWHSGIVAAKDLRRFMWKFCNHLVITCYQAAARKDSSVFRPRNSRLLLILFKDYKLKCKRPGVLMHAPSDRKDDACWVLGGSFSDVVMHATLFIVVSSITWIFIRLRRRLPVTAWQKKSQEKSFRCTWFGTQ